jgi:transcriptional regulator with GAF, ATPase, and Fis domain
LVVLEGLDEGQEFVVDKDRVRVGTGAHCDVVLKDDTVSRQHFEIVLTEKGHLIRDLDSTNGTDLEGFRVNEAYLQPGARIGAGELLMVFQPSTERVDIPLSNHEAFGAMLGRSHHMRAMFYMAERVAQRDTTVLLTGETGTGKGMLAEEIHRHSARQDKPFVVVDCSTIPNQLMESELFGHIKGAFTGAIQTRQGAFAEADGGTIFFDEIGELPAQLQPKLLRVLETRQIKPVGGNDTMQVDVRIVAATNRELLEEVQGGRFREDLYFRLSVFEIAIPALRDRKDDIGYLARAFLQDIPAGKNRRFSDEAIQLLGRHDWPGNVRELHNVIERVAQLVDSEIIDQVNLLSSSLAGANLVRGKGGTSGRGNLPIHEAKELAEQEYLHDLLRRHHQNVTAAARTAGIHRQSLHRLLRKHGIQAGASPDRNR